MAMNDVDMYAIDAQSSRKTYALVIFLLATMALFFGATLCLAQSDLIAFIPPDAPVIAGLHRMPADRSKDALWLSTRNNLDDLKQFVTLSNNDLDRRLDQVIIADWASSGGSLGSHLAVVKGRFNLASMTATMAHPVKLSYAGVPVIEIDMRNSSEPGPRWLAVPERRIALFGTPAAVRYALDRFRSGAAADARLIERLKNASARDSAWSSISLDAEPQQSRFDVGSVANTLLPCLGRMREVDLGIRIGKTVKIDVHAESYDGANGSVQCMTAALFGGSVAGERVAFGFGGRPDVRLTLTRGDYERWLDTFQKSRLNQGLEALLSASNASTQPTLESTGAVR